MEKVSFIKISANYIIIISVNTFTTTIHKNTTAL